MVLRVTLVYITTPMGNVLGKLFTFSKLFMDELKNVVGLTLGD